MLSACQLLLMRRTRGRAIDIAIAPIGTVISQTQTSGGAYSGVSVMLGSRLSLDRFAEWIERRSWPVQSWLWALSCYAAAAHPSIQRNARRCRSWSSTEMTALAFNVGFTLVISTGRR